MEDLFTPQKTEDHRVNLLRTALVNLMEAVRLGDDMEIGNAFEDARVILGRVEQ